MDPASIVGLVASCTALISTVGKSSVAIHSFIRSCRDARKELTDTTRQLVELDIILKLIKDDFEPFSRGDCQQLQIPDSLATEVPSIITNCSMVVAEIDTLIAQYSNSSRGTGVKWTMSGREKTSALNRQLDAHVRCLNLALDFLKLSITKSIHKDTQQLVQDSAVIKDNVELLPEIRDQIDELRDQIENLPAHLGSNSGSHQQSGFALQRWLETATSYYEGSVVGDHGASAYNGGLPAASDSGDDTDKIETETVPQKSVEPLVDQGTSRKEQSSNLSMSSTQGVQVGQYHNTKKASTFSGGQTAHDGSLGRAGNSDPPDVQSGPQAAMEYEVEGRSRSSHSNSELHAPSIITDPSESKAYMYEGSGFRAKYSSLSFSSLRPGLSCLSPDGQHIFYQTSEDEVTVVQTNEGRVAGKVRVRRRDSYWASRLARFPDQCFERVLSTPNGDAFLVHDGFSMPRIYDWKSNSQFKWFLPEGYDMTRIVFPGCFGISPNGRFLVVYSHQSAELSFRELFGLRFSAKLTIWMIDYDRRSINVWLVADNWSKALPGANLTNIGLTLSPDRTQSLSDLIFTTPGKSKNTTDVFVQPVGQTRWNPRRFALPGHQFKVSTHPNTPIPRSSQQGEQIFLQSWEDNGYSSLFGGLQQLKIPRYTIEGKQSQCLYLNWIVNAEYGGKRPSNRISFIKILWVSNSGSLAVTISGRLHSKSGFALHVSIWHTGNKERLFGPEKLESGQGHKIRATLSSPCGADMKGGVLFVCWETQFWFWKFDQSIMLDT